MKDYIIETIYKIIKVPMNMYSKQKQRPGI